MKKSIGYIELAVVLILLVIIVRVWTYKKPEKELPQSTTPKPTSEYIRWEGETRVIGYCSKKSYQERQSRRIFLKKGIAAGLGFTTGACICWWLDNPYQLTAGIR